MKFLLQTQIGIEAITELELEKKFKSKYSMDYIAFVPHKNGLVQIDCPEPSVTGSQKGNLQRPGIDLDFYKDLGTVEDAFYILDYVKDIPKESTTRDLLRKLDINKIKKNLDFYFDKLNNFDNLGDFRFVTRKKAVNDFRRVDLNRDIKTFFERNISRVKVTEEEGVKEIWTTLVKNRLIIGVRLTNKAKRHGYYKTSMVHGSLRPTVANAMAFVSDIYSKDSIWDPFCGAGTIPCELIENFKFGKLICSDISEDAINATTENLGNTKGFKQFKSKVALKVQDFFESKDYAATIISNLPFGTQYSFGADFKNKLARKFNEVKDLGQITLLFTEVLEIPNFQLTRKFELEVLGHHCFILVYKKVK